MTEENFKNKEKIEKKENVRKEGGRTRRPYNKKKKLKIKKKKKKKKM